MRLWTIQAKSVWEKLLETGVSSGDPDFKADWGDEPGTWGFSDAYSWMASQMESRGLSRPGAGVWPVWAWAKSPSAADCRGRPSGRDERNGEEQVMLEIEVGEERLLLSDFGFWHHALNYWPISVGDAEEAEHDVLMSSNGWDPFKDKPLPPDGDAWLRSTWDRIFDVSMDDGAWRGPDGERGGAVQAVMWELRLGDVRKKLRLPPLPARLRDGGMR